MHEVTKDEPWVHKAVGVWREPSSRDFRLCSVLRALAIREFAQYQYSRRKRPSLGFLQVRRAPLRIDSGEPSEDIHITRRAERYQT